MVNCAVEGGRYPAMQKLVLAGAQEFGGADELIFGEYPEGCPSHTERMYMFKMYAIGAAFQLNIPSGGTLANFLGLKMKGAQ